MCLLGNRLLSEENSGNCTKEEGSALWNLYCKYQEDIVEGVSAIGANLTSRVVKCDPYFLSHNTSLVPGIRGLASGVFMGIITFFIVIFVFQLYSERDVIQIHVVLVTSRKSWSLAFRRGPSRGKDHEPRGHWDFGSAALQPGVVGYINNVHLIGWHLLPQRYWYIKKEKNNVHISLPLKRTIPNGFW